MVYLGYCFLGILSFGSLNILVICLTLISRGILHISVGCWIREGYLLKILAPLRRIPNPEGCRLTRWVSPPPLLFFFATITTYF